MAGWKAKRFWKTVSVVPEGQGWGLRLDARVLQTPAKAPLIVPTAAMAEAIAEEWRAQEGEIRPALMPVSRAANSAIDKVTLQQAEVAAIIADYGMTDLLCYRATGPEVLVQRQAAAWDGLLDWVAKELGAPLLVTAGVMAVPQPASSIARLRAVVGGFDPFRLTALHDLVAISGSLVIGLATARGHLQPDAAWRAARIDEDWQAEQWGRDAEAAAEAAAKAAALAEAARFLQLCELSAG